MSTKTTFKRIALVAVAALGLGVLSVAPSSAVVSSLTVTVADGTATLTKADSTTAGTITLSGLFEYGDTATITSVVKSYPAGAATAAGQIVLQNLDSLTPNTSGVTVDSGTVSSTNPAVRMTVLETSTTGSMRIANGSVGAKYVSHKIGVQFDSLTATSRVAGTYVLTVLVKTAGSAGATDVQTVSKDISIVIAAPANEAEEPSAAYTAVYLANGATISPNADSTTINNVATASTSAKAANLNVMLRNSLNGAFAVDTVTITVTGPGLLYTGSAYTKYVKLIGLTGDNNYAIYPDGTSGVTTIGVSFEVTGQTFTKSMTFYSAAAKSITAATFNPALAIGDNNTAVAVVATDSNGNPWTGAAFIYASSAADALIAGSATPVACAAWNSTTGILCPVTATTVGTAKFKVIDASTVALATATSNEVSVTVAQQTAASVKLSFDKATYAPNEKAIITVTPLSAAGNTVQGKTWTALLASGGITSTSAFSAGSDTLTATAMTTSAFTSSSANAGATTYVVYMPSASGDVTISATGGSNVAAAGQIKVTAVATVVNASVDAATDAANEATDAANAATDAALAAADSADAATEAAQEASDAVAELSTQVAALMASLKAQIKSLTNLVIKIQKKLK